MYNLQLQRLRRAAGYKSQQEFASKLNVGLRKYETWERAEVKLPLEDACKIADILDCTLDELAGREHKSNRPVYIDRRQAEMNEHYESVGGEQGKDAIAASVMAIAASFAVKHSEVETHTRRKAVGE